MSKRELFYGLIILKLKRKIKIRNFSNLFAFLGLQVKFSELYQTNLPLMGHYLNLSEKIF